MNVSATADVISSFLLLVFQNKSIQEVSVSPFRARFPRTVMPTLCANVGYGKRENGVHGEMENGARADDMTYACGSQQAHIWYIGKLARWRNGSNSSTVTRTIKECQYSVDT